jgi:hypothetical protein
MSWRLVIQRLLLVAAVPSSYLITLIPLLFVGWDGPWLAELLFFGPSPFLALAAATVAVFPQPVLRDPMIWAFAGAGMVLVLSTAAIWAMTGDLWGLLGLPFAVVTPLVFWGLVKVLRIDAWTVSTC